MALLLGIAAAIAVWGVGPLVRPELGQVWFVGAGDWQGILLHGRDIAGAAAGLFVWIAALHIPRRGKVIAGIRVGAMARSEVEAPAM
jgi:hypothetical protein